MATLYKRRGKDGKPAKTWSANFWIDGRKFLRSTGCNTKREAEAALAGIEAEIRAEIRRKELGIARLTLDTLLGTWWTEVGQYHSTTLRTTKYYIKALLKHLPADLLLEELSNKHIAAFVVARQRNGLKASSICRELDVLESAWHRARDLWEHPVRPIAWRQHRPRRPERTADNHLSVEQALKLIAWMRENGAEHIAQAVAFSIYSGVRLAGTASLDWSRVDMQARTFDVKIKRKPGQREDRWRRKHLSVNAITLLMAIGPKDEGPVFDLTNRRKHWEAARAAIGRPDVTWHGFRHSHGTWLRKGATDIEVVQRSLNHSSIAMTMVYAHVGDEELVAALDTLPPLWDHGSNLIAIPPSGALPLS